MYEGMYRTCFGEIICAISSEPAEQKVTYMDFSGKVHTVDESVFLRREKYMVGDMVDIFCEEDNMTTPWVRKINGWDFVRWSFSNDVVSPKVDKEIYAPK